MNNSRTARSREKKKLVIFHRNVTADEKNIFILKLLKAGAWPLSVNNIPYVNGMILTIPETFALGVLMEDHRVARVSDPD